jgi:hypothetical protein
VNNEEYWERMKNRTAEDWQKNVGPGWAKLVEQAWNLTHAEGTYATDVKEKWGGLRFYIAYGSEELHDAIWAIEHESYKICEVCGRPGKPRSTGWIRTLCIRHYARLWLMGKKRYIKFRLQQRRLNKRRKKNGRTGSR